MISLKHLLTEQTAATLFCKNRVLARPEFSANKWKAIGIWSNRNIAGTNIRSQHAVGNAIDWHGAKGIGDPVMKKLANHLVKNSEIYQIQNVIYNKKIWNQPAGWHTYTGENPHIDHVHVDFRVISNVSDSVKKQHNDAIVKALSDLQYILEENPKKYFSKFKGIFNDDEDGAASYFEQIYKQLIQVPIIDKFGSKLSFEDKKNITAIKDACIDVFKIIKKGEGIKIEFPFELWNPVTKKYTTQLKTIKWDYM